MSSDYHRHIVVEFEGKLPIDEHGHYLDVNTVTPVTHEQVWSYRLHRALKRTKSPRKVAEYNICNKDLLGNRRKFFWATDLTSPYGCLQWAIGSGDDFTCFDYAFLPDGRVVLHSTFNTETGSYIGDCSYDTFDAKDAPDAAMELVGEGLETACMNGVRHTKAGWNQDPYYFYRCVFLSCDPNLDTPSFSEREKRMGGKRINKYCDLPVDIHKAIW